MILPSICFNLTLEILFTDRRGARVTRTPCWLSFNLTLEILFTDRLFRALPPSLAIPKFQSHT